MSGVMALKQQPARRGVNNITATGVKNFAMECRCGDCLAESLTQCSGRHFHAGEHLFQEGDTQKFLYRIRRGFIRVYKTIGAGRRKVINLASPGEFLGLGIKDNFQYSAQAITTAEVCCFSKATLQSRAIECATLANRLYKELSLELEAAHRLAIMLSQPNSQQRLAAFLIMLFHRNKPQATDPKHIFLPMPRSDIADFLNLTIETVSRTLTKFKNGKLIEIGKPRYIRIIDVATLTEMADSGH